MNKSNFFVGVFVTVAFATFVMAFVFDTDGGFNIYQKGTCTDDFGNHTDICTSFSGGNLREWYPVNDTNGTGGYCASAIVNCSNYNSSCSNGRCI